MKYFVRGLGLVLFVSVMMAAVWARAATLPSNFSEVPIATGLSSATAMAFAPDGRLFVAQQGGQLRIVKNDVLLPTPFVSITVNSSGERGLLGVTFDPNFASNGYVYVYYTATTPTIHNRVSRFTANGDVAVPGSEVVIQDLETLTATNHNGGAIHFGPDGYLYIATGENAVPAYSQTLANRLGKILRISANGVIPSDNPFFTSATGANRAIWALGLRNPYTFSFQPGTGRMFVNDVGQGTWEEVNQGVAGANFGWPDTEGPTSNPAFDPPVLAYSHAVEPSVCAITGGAFYDASVGTYPAAYAGDYFYADFCAGWIRRFDVATSAVTAFATGAASPVDLQTGPDGRLYYLARSSGSVLRVDHCSGTSPTLASIEPATAQAGSLTLASGTNFQAGARVQFGLFPVQSQVVDGDLMTQVPTALKPGAISVRVVNPNGCRSNAVAFTVAPSSSCGLLGIEPLLLLAGLRVLRLRRRG